MGTPAPLSSTPTEVDSHKEEKKEEKRRRWIAGKLIFLIHQIGVKGEEKSRFWCDIIHF